MSGVWKRGCGARHVFMPLDSRRQVSFRRRLDPQALTNGIRFYRLQRVEP